MGSETPSFETVGMKCDLLSPYVFYDNHPIQLRFQVTHTGDDCTGVISVQLLNSDNDLLKNSDSEATLRKDAPINIDFESAGPLAAGKYCARVAVSVSGETPRLLSNHEVYITEYVNYKTLFDIGVATSYRDRGPAFFQTLRDEGVGVFMAARDPGWKDISEKNIEILGPYGFKIWNMVTLFSGPPRVCADPGLMSQNRDYAGKLGFYLKDKPIILNQVMMGESLQYPVCYCAECNRSFRDYLRDEYTSIHHLNEAWQADYKMWEDVEQLGTPADLDRAIEALKERVLQLELPKKGTEQWKALFLADPTRAIEWKRWHDDLLKIWYADFVTAFKETNGDVTAVSEQPCWPDFRYHMLFHLGAIADLGGLDAYLPGGLPQTLGKPANLMLNIDLNASVFHGKPLWCHELYVQPNSPARLPEAQGWFLVGRGYSLVNYFTYTAMPEGEREGKPLFYGLRSTEGEPYPAHPSFVRFSFQMKDFHRRYDAHSLRREEPRIAVFMGDDVSLANNLETGTATWDAPGVLAHTGAYWLTLRNGYPVEFINDNSFERLDGKDVLIVPRTHVISQRTLRALMDYAANGGTLIIDGPIGLYDERYRRNTMLPGGEVFSRGQHVRYDDYRNAPNGILVTKGDFGSDQLNPTNVIPSIGMPMGLTLGNQTRVLLNDVNGNAALVHQGFGEGQLYTFLTSLSLRHNSWPLDQNALRLWRGLLEDCGLKPRHHKRAVSNDSNSLCDISIRIKNDDELFIFATDFFGPWQGEIELDLPPGAYEAEDALRQTAIPIKMRNDRYVFPITLSSFDGQVVRVKCTDGSPFVEW